MRNDLLTTDYKTIMAQLFREKRLYYFVDLSYRILTLLGAIIDCEAFSICLSSLVLFALNTVMISLLVLQGI